MPDTTTGEARRPPGRPRNEDADREIVAATLKLLAEQGYDRTSMEAVAAEADVTRATVYRRWPSKAELVCAALTAYPDDGPAAQPEDVRGFLVNMLSAFREGIQACDGVAICSSLYLNRHDHPEMLEQFRTAVVAPRVERMSSVLESAIAAGKVREGIDVEMVVSMLFGAGIQRILTGHTLPREWPERAVAAVWPMLAPA
ncbi:MAG TPA: TetR/AcrR family transcriptional regulator [Gaiellales bacterium]|nr:TetR/AcrR family transcriptional regulator [Gaiellales bacterium]